MSWLSDLKWSNRLEHLYAMIAGEEELDESVPSTYDRKQGFLYHIAEKIQGGTLPDASEASDGDVLTIDDGEPVWAAPSGGGQFLVTITRTGETTGTSDKSASEIIAAFEAGQTPVAVLAASEGIYTIFVFQLYVSTSGSESASFAFPLGSSTATVAEDKSVEFDTM